MAASYNRSTRFLFVKFAYESAEDEKYLRNSRSRDSKTLWSARAGYLPTGLRE